jgi:hypothetical protein
MLAKDSKVTGRAGALNIVGLTAQGRQRIAFAFPLTVAELVRQEANNIGFP